MPDTICVIIPTRDRPDDLELTIHTLFAQTVLPQHVIIVDQSLDTVSKRRVEGAFAGAQDKIRRTVRLSYLLDPSISGGAVARNRAMDIADCDIWLFLDDDVELEPDFNEQILLAYRARPEAIGVSGVVTNYNPPALEFRAWARVFCTGAFWDERQPVYWRAARKEGAELVRVRRFGAGLMSFRAEAVRNLRFDSKLSGTSDGEDVDFCMHLSPGSSLFINPKARLVHNSSPLGRPRDHWLVRHARTHWYLYKRNWNYGLNRISFAWLNVGYLTIALMVCCRRMSLDVYKGYLQATREGRALVEKALNTGV